MSYVVVDDALEEQLAQEQKSRGDWLFLEPHSEFSGQWRVECWDAHYYFDFRDLIGPYKAVSPVKLGAFLALAEKLEYKVAFFEDPATILDGYEELNREPDIHLISSFENTVNGLLPFQVQGYNMLKDLNTGVARWDTGTGKTVLATGLIQHHQQEDNFDTAFIVTKKTSKVNTQRKLYDLAELNTSIPVQQTKKELKKGTYYPRQEYWKDVLDQESALVVMNYETFRVALEEIVPVFDDRRILIIWDEMPTKLSSRDSQLYKAVKWCLFDDKGPGCNPKCQRPSWLTQYMLSATPIENSPEGWFNCMRLLDPTVYGTVSKFESEFVTAFSPYGKKTPFNPEGKGKPESWHKLDKIGLMAAHLTHEVDKSDPDIAEQFPEVIEEMYYCDWGDADRKLYNEILRRGDLHNVNPIALISLLQMVCDEPTMLENSAAIYAEFEEAYSIWEEDEIGNPPDKKGSATAIELIQGLNCSSKDHGKQEALEYLLCERHKGEKTLVFSALNESLMPTLERLLKKWGINYVRYNGTDKQKQAAQDAFMEDPDVEVFLTSDMGSDSLDLYVGQNVINYNLPWKWSTKIQRQNRIHRASSGRTHNYVYTLVYDHSIEERKDEVIMQKKGYHDAIFKGVIRDNAMSARMTRADLYYILGLS